MKKCTLCVDRIYNENLPEEDREPACVRTCPAGRAAFRRSGRSRQRGQPAGGRTRRHGPDARTGHANRSTSTCRRAPDARAEVDVLAPFLEPVAEDAQGLLGWLDRRWRSSDASGAVGHRLHRAVGSGLRAAGLARCRCAWCQGWVAFVFFAIAYAAWPWAGFWPRPSHLGRPAARSRRFSQWRSSWLSREAWCRSRRWRDGGIFGAGLVFWGDRWRRWAGWRGGVVAGHGRLHGDDLYPAEDGAALADVADAGGVRGCLAHRGRAAGRAGDLAALVLLPRGGGAGGVVAAGDKRVARSATIPGTATGLGGIRPGAPSSRRIPADQLPDARIRS